MVELFLMKQRSFFLNESPIFGGASLKNCRHHRRVLSSKKPIHLVLKATQNALYKNREFIRITLLRQAKIAGVSVYDFNINFDHIHVQMKIPNRLLYCRFVRALTGLISRKLGRGLWKLRPFTRVSEWGRAFSKLKEYIAQNNLEVEGRIPYKSRKKVKSIEPP